MRSRDRPDDEKPEARAFYFGCAAAAYAVKAFEDALELVLWNAYSTVADAKHHPLFVRRFDADGDVNIPQGIFDRVVEHIGYGSAKLFRITENENFGRRPCEQRVLWLGIACRLTVRGCKVQRVGVQMVAGTRKFHALGDEVAQVNFGAVLFAALVSHLAGFQNLLDGSQQAVGIVQHELVKLLPLFFLHFASLERFEIQANGSD